MPTRPSMLLTLAVVGLALSGPGCDKGGAGETTTPDPPADHEPDVAPPDAEPPSADPDPAEGGAIDDGPDDPPG